MLEKTKPQKLEREAHQWVHQAIPNLEKVDIICPQMKQLIETAEEKDQFMGPDMERIAEVSILEKMLILSNIDYTHHRHPEDFAKLERFPTSPHSNSTSHC